MWIKNYVGKILIVGVLCTAFLVQPAQAYAWWRGGYGWGWHGGWGWGAPVAAGIVLGAAATAVWIAGHQYYYDDGLYYDYTPSGYVVVQPPVETVVAPPQTAVTEAPMVETPGPAAPPMSDDVITVNVPNAKGGYTSVVIKRSGNGFVGPQGEFYPEFPKVSQLSLMYGK